MLLVPEKKNIPPRWIMSILLPFLIFFTFVYNFDKSIENRFKKKVSFYVRL